MIIYPAIDIKDGKCVRLKQGDFKEVTVFNDEPFKVAKAWEEAGSSYIHVVDLDGARKGVGYNNDVIKKIISSINVPIQVGGGIRTLDDIKEKIDFGVSRVILGTVAIKNPEFVKNAVERFGDKIAVGIDAKNGKVAIAGWEEISEIDATQLCLDMKTFGVKTIIYTDISKDGMMQGPNIEETKKIIDISSLNIIASGGVSCINDLERVSEINAHGVIIGKALYQNAINLKEAIECFERRTI